MPCHAMPCHATHTIGCIMFVLKSSHSHDVLFDCFSRTLCLSSKLLSFSVRCCCQYIYSLFAWRMVPMCPSPYRTIAHVSQPSNKHSTVLHIQNILHWTSCSHYQLHLYHLSFCFGCSAIARWQYIALLNARVSHSLCRSQQSADQEGPLQSILIRSSYCNVQKQIKWAFQLAWLYIPHSYTCTPCTPRLFLHSFYCHRVWTHTNTHTKLV